MSPQDVRAALDALVGSSGASYAALSRMLRRNPAYLQQYVKRGSPRSLDEDDRRLLAAFFGVDEAVLGGPPRIAIPSIRRLDLAASAGSGRFADDDRQAGTMIIDPAVLGSFGLDRATASLMPAAGDSMAPTIEDGDMMLIDQRDRRPSARGGVYVLRLDGTLLVKRVARSRGSTLAITSDNPFYPPLSGSAGCEIIGRVVWLSRALR